MPQLKKVALAMGNNLVYADTYPQALAQLAGEKLPAAPAAPAEQAPPPQTTSTGNAAPAQASTQQPDARIAEIRQHLDHYRQLVSQGKLAEAGKELEAIQGLVQK